MSRRLVGAPGQIWQRKLVQEGWPGGPWTMFLVEWQFAACGGATGQQGIDALCDVAVYCTACCYCHVKVCVDSVGTER